ncbi:uncharacterized protein C8A04DRAFT_38226 [Dichotomopilus funicola]|uniref:FAM50A/XAP5 C-terminal domain-containing protein n=1 Tax=Dichotomopilus funicola TaxID=1934379 RepID=A0AAN6ZL83_9PEZI|nr:hypothetical protein C8A04DRAFT_38226 [Dichotomopilus funicola]
MAGIKRKAPDDDGPDDQPSADLLPQDPPTRKPERGKPHSRLGPPAPGVSADAYFRQLYGSGPDFRSLARRDARFAAVAQSNGQLDFSDPAATMQLTKTLLKIDFGLEIDLPDDRLCPPVPNRHNYILWLKELMDSTSYEQPGRKLIGLDIGTGASCIYPILGTAQRPWHFVATDIDTKSLGYAEKNVRLNRLDEQVRVLQRKPADPLIPLDDAGVQSIDFTMMNPPFYTSEDDMLSSANKKSRPPMSACTGAPVEMVCEGGEVAHVGRLLRESLVLREKVQWYTSMVGKLSSLETLVDQLVEKGIHNYAVTEFVQGNKTRRWALGWSFTAMRPVEHAARGMKALLWKKILPHPVTAELCVLPPDRPVDDVVTHIRDHHKSEMSDPSRGAASRFTPQNQTTHERLSTNTVGLVALSDFRKRRAEVLEQQEREAREAAATATRPNATTTNNSTPDRSLTATPNNNANSSADDGEGDKLKKRKRPRRAKALVSFGDDEEEEEESGPRVISVKGKMAKKGGGNGNDESVTREASASAEDDMDQGKTKGGKAAAKFGANSSVGIVPRALTKAALRKEAAEREALRKEFLLLQAAVKATEIAIPFVFYDGTNIPGGVVRVKKGDFVWLFLDKGRKVGAQLRVGADKSANARRDWARVSVDDLMLVRGNMIIPHHYEFYFFIINKTTGPGDKLLFEYSSEAPTTTNSAAGGTSTAGLSRAPALSELEGALDDPTLTKVVDRRWYQRNKHIYPANLWQNFDPEKDYSKDIRRDPGGNAFFFSG